MLCLFDEDASGTWFETSVLQVCRRFFWSGIDVLYRNIRFVIFNQKEHDRFLRFHGLLTTPQRSLAVMAEQEQRMVLRTPSSMLMKTKTMVVEIYPSIVSFPNDYTTTHPALCLARCNLRPGMLCITVDGLLDDIEEHRIAFDMAKVVHRLSRSVRHLAILLRLRT